MNPKGKIMNWLELLKAAGIEIDTEKGEALNAALSAAVKEQIDSSVNEATTGLKSKNDELLGKLKTQQTATQEATAAAEKAARDKMSNDELNTSWQTRYDSDLAVKQSIIDDMINSSCGEKSDALAMAIATEINPQYPKTVLPLVKHSIKTESVDGKFETYFVGEDGKRSVQTKEEFVKAFCDNKDYAPVVSVNMGRQTKTSVTTQEAGEGSAKTDYNSMSQQERAAYISNKYGEA